MLKKFFTVKARLIALIAVAAFILIAVVIETLGLTAASRFGRKVSERNTSAAAYKPDASGTVTTADGNTVTYTSGTEQLAITGEFGELDDDTKVASYLGDTSLAELIDMTLQPFGKADADNPPFADITLICEYRETHRHSPTGAEISAHREELKRARLAEKRAAAEAEAARKEEELKAQREKEKAEREKAKAEAEPVDLSALRLSLLSPYQLMQLDMEVEKFVTDYSSHGIIKTAPEILAERERLLSAFVSIYHHNEWEDIMSRISVQEETEPEEEIHVEPEAVYLTDADLSLIETELTGWIADNTVLTEEYVSVPYVFYGEELRQLVNSLHTPWQITYVLSVFRQLYRETEHGTQSGTEHIVIRREVFEENSEVLNKTDFSLLYDFWNGEWDGKEIGFSEYASLFTTPEGTKCYDEWIEDYTDEPVVIADGDELLNVEKWSPRVVFDWTEDWCRHTEYLPVSDGTERTPVNIAQAKKGASVSPVMAELVGMLDIGHTDVLMLADMLKNLPESGQLAADFEMAGRLLTE